MALGDENLSGLSGCDTVPGLLIHRVGSGDSPLASGGTWVGGCCCQCPCCKDQLDLTHPNFDQLRLDVVGGIGSCGGWNSDCWNLSRESLPPASEYYRRKCAWTIGHSPQGPGYSCTVFSGAAPGGGCGSTTTSSSGSLLGVRMSCWRGGAFEEESPLCPGRGYLATPGGGVFLLEAEFVASACYTNTGTVFLWSTSVSCNPFRVAFSLAQLELNSVCVSLQNCDISSSEWVIYCSDDCD